MGDNPFVNQQQSNPGQQEPANVPPESDAVTREEFNALKQEFDAFRQKTEALTKTPPAPAADSSSSLEEYLPFALIVILLVMAVLFLTYRISEVRGAFRKLESDFNDYKKKPPLLKKKPWRRTATVPCQKIL